MTAPDPAQVARFARDLATLPESGGRLLLAVSGGPDSIALLILAHAAMSDRIACATVDHGLRDAAADEAAMVATLCADLGIAHATLRPPDRLDRAGGNVQARARQARYAVLARHAADSGCAAMLTAHHVDDQAETFLMRAARGAGLPGLSGVRATGRVEVHDWHPGYPGGGVVAVADVRPIAVLRPLLGWRRAELRTIATQSGYGFVDDPTNRDARFDRTRFRALLAANDWIDAARIAATAGHIAEANAALEAMTAWFWRARILASPVGDVRIDTADLPREITRRLARQAINTVRLEQAITRPDWDEGGNVEALLDALHAGRGATHAGVRASAAGSVWHFREAPPRRSH